VEMDLQGMRRCFQIQLDLDRIYSNDDIVRNWRYNTFQYTRKTSILVWIVSINTPIRKLRLHGNDEGWKQEGKMDINSGSKHSSKKRRLYESLKEEYAHQT
jgi:hypothetical protein